MKTSISFLKSNFDVKTTLSKIDDSLADFIHVDLMDGKFVENKSFTKTEFINLLSNKEKPLDVHLMAKNPLKYIYDFAELNTEYITFHFEAVSNHLEVIEEIKSIGLKVGVSIKPKTKVEEIKAILPFVDQVLVMSVEPGLGGQEFMESALEKISKLKVLKEELNCNYIICVDGGINDTNINLIKDAGADMVVSGYYVCSEENFDERIAKLNV